MASHHIRNQVPNDIDTSYQIILAQSQKSQTYLNKIQTWTKKQKIELNEEKMKCMVFNFTKKKQFSTRLNLNE